MAEKLGLGNEIHELKIGESFTDPKSKAFHTIRYDFFPASVDGTKKATMEVGDNHQVTIRVPHLGNAGTSQTTFKGSRRDYTKECVIIIDKVTGEITLERLACNIQVKKTRSENNRPTQDRPQSLASNSSNSNSNNNLTIRSATPPTNNAGHRVSNKTRVTSGSRRPDRPITRLIPKKTSPPIISPGRRSPNNSTTLGVGGPNHRSSPGKLKDSHSVNENHSNGSTSTLASLPMIGIDDFTDPMPSQPHSSNNINSNNYMLSSILPNDIQSGKSSPPFFNSNHSDNENKIETMSSSTSSSSDSDSDSDAPMPPANSKSNLNTDDLATLDEDLCLSESGSDSN